MPVIIDGTAGITSPGGDTATVSVATPIVKSPSSLTLQTNGSTTALTINTAQNVGVGITPSAWGAGYNVIQTPGFSVWGQTTLGHLSTNTYFDGSVYKYADNGYAHDYYQYGGSHIFRVSDVGTTGGTIATFANVIAVAKGQSLALQGASSQTGTGITFPATQSASTDPNTLDDYEEGTWTPTDVSGAGLSFSGAVGFYTKVGRCVTACFRVDFPSTANGAQVKIGGLPFTVLSGNDGASSGTFIRYTTYANSFTLPPGNGETNMPAYTYGGTGIANSAFSLKRIDAVVVYFV